MIHGVAAVSGRRRAWSPSSDEVGGLFFDFEPFRGETASKLHRAMATSRIEEVGTPSPHVAGRELDARVRIVRDIVIIPKLHEASLRPRVLLARVGVGGLLLCTLALFQLIPFFFL